MDKLRTLLLLTCLAVLSTALAGPVSENEARGIASQFLTQKSIQAPSLRTAHKALLQDPTKPLLNRATQATYSPGSTFNTIQALVCQEDRRPPY